VIWVMLLYRISYRIFDNAQVGYVLVYLRHARAKRKGSACLGAEAGGSRTVSLREAEFPPELHRSSRFSQRESLCCVADRVTEQDELLICVQSSIGPWAQDDVPFSNRADVVNLYPAAPSTTT